MTDHPTMETGTPKNKGPSSGCLLLAGLVLIGGSFVFYGFWHISATVSNFEDGYLDAGYALVEGADVVISEPVQIDTYIYGKHSILIEKGSLADLALISNDAVIRGIVEGDVAFLGSDIEIAEDGIINGNLNVTMAKNVVIRGQGRWRDQRNVDQAVRKLQFKRFCRSIHEHGCRRNLDRFNDPL